MVAITLTTPTGRPGSWRAVSRKALSIRANIRTIIGEPRGMPSGASAADGLRAVPAEPRPDRQPRVRRTADDAGGPRGAGGGDRAADACPADPAAVHGRREARAGRRSCSSPITTRNLAMRCARDGATSSRSSPRSPIPPPASGFPTRTRRRPLPPRCRMRTRHSGRRVRHCTAA